MLTLHQFPISHYCEKVRWALDYKGIDYQIKNHLPGLHSRTATRLASSSSLPILVHGDKVVQSSSDIITYLDSQFPQTPLTPENKALKPEALDWEKFADEQIGIAVRLICYNVLLDHPKVVIPFFTHNGPWYGPLVMKVAFPKLSAVMRNKMMISAQTAAKANRQLSNALDKVNAQLQNRPFLVGDKFSRADLAVASLLAPLCKPKQYGLDWPEHYPEPLEAIIAQHREKLTWVDKLYVNHR